MDRSVGKRQGDRGEAGKSGQSGGAQSPGGDLRASLQNAENFAALVEILRRESLESFTARDFDRSARALLRHPHANPLRVAYLGNHTIEPLPRYVAVSAAARGVAVESQVGGYNLFMQDVLDPASEVRSFNPQVIFLSLSLRELAPRIVFSFLSLSETDIDEETERVLGLIQDWVAAAKSSTSATLLLANFSSPTELQAGLADSDLPRSEAGFYRALAAGLETIVRGGPRVFAVDVDRVLSTFGRDRARDEKMFYLAKMHWSEAVLPGLARELSRSVHALVRPARKCLVLDLDGTLWGGVVGEDGVDGIQIGVGNPAGEAFDEIQRVVLALKARGVLLAICSKNNEADVREVFQTRREILLCWEDFAAAEINWQPKNENLQRIAARLQIGIDSLVFVDDNPVECALVREILPEVQTIELSGDPSLRPQILRRLFEFDQLQLTEEDLRKTAQYQENSQRQSDQFSAGDLTSFLEGLETEVRFGLASSKHLDRVHQLFAKTNQFNLTTKRYSRGEVENFVADPAWELFIGRVRDRFGDLGLVAVCLVERIGMDARIDSFLLSCRVMGRGVETSILNSLKRRYLENQGLNRMDAKFEATAKNKPVEDLYERQGFALVENSLQSGVSGKSYVLASEKAEMLPTPGITVVSLEDA